MGRRNGGTTGNGLRWRIDTGLTTLGKGVPLQLVVGWGAAAKRRRGDGIPLGRGRWNRETRRLEDGRLCCLPCVYYGSGGGRRGGGVGRVGGDGGVVDCSVGCLVRVRESGGTGRYAILVSGRTFPTFDVSEILHSAHHPTWTGPCLSTHPVSNAFLSSITYCYSANTTATTLFPLSAG